MFKHEGFPQPRLEKKEGFAVLRILDTMTIQTDWSDYVQSNEEITDKLEKCSSLKDALKRRFDEVGKDKRLPDADEMFPVFINDDYVGDVNYDPINDRIKFEVKLDSLHSIGWSSERIAKFDDHMQAWNKKVLPPEIVICAHDNVYEWLKSKGITGKRVKPIRNEIWKKIVIGSLPVHLIPDTYCLVYPHFFRYQPDREITHSALNQRFEYFHVFTMKDCNTMNLKQAKSLIEGDEATMKELLIVTK